MGGRSGGGGGGGGGTAGTSMTGSLAAKAAVRNFLGKGLKGFQVPMSGIRQESLDHLRAGGAVYGTTGIRVTIYPGGKPGISDGRHRILVGREQGKKSLVGTVEVMGPRGGIQATYRGPIKI